MCRCVDAFLSFLHTHMDLTAHDVLHVEKLPRGSPHLATGVEMALEKAGAAGGGGRGAGRDRSRVCCFFIMLLLEPEALLLDSLGGLGDLLTLGAGDGHGKAVHVGCGVVGVLSYVSGC